MTDLVGLFCKSVAAEAFQPGVNFISWGYNESNSFLASHALGSDR
jgi:hypothetical protein